jgi:hypothetical protein
MHFPYLFAISCADRSHALAGRTLQKRDASGPLKQSSISMVFEAPSEVTERSTIVGTKVNNGFDG